MSTDSCPGKPGDLVVFPRIKGLYTHYAVNVGNGYIIHATLVLDDRVGSRDFVCCCSSASNVAEVKKEKYSEFVKQGDKVIVEDGSCKAGKPPLPVEEIIERAHSRIGKRDYSILWNNCEHFARWCRYGEEKSDQADDVKIMGGAAVFVLVFVLVLLLAVIIGYKKT